MQDVSTDALNQQMSSLSSLASDPAQLAGGGEFATLDLVGGIAGSSAGVGSRPAPTHRRAPRSRTCAARACWAATRRSSTSRRTRRPSRRPRADALREHGPALPPEPHAPRPERDAPAERLDAPTVTLSNPEVLTAMTDAISSLSAAQLSTAVNGEAPATISTANVMMSSGARVSPRIHGSLSSSSSHSSVPQCVALTLSFLDRAAAPSDRRGRRARAPASAARTRHFARLVRGRDVRERHRRSRTAPRSTRRSSSTGPTSLPARTRRHADESALRASACRRSRRTSTARGGAAGCGSCRAAAAVGEEDESEPLTLVLQNIKPIDYGGDSRTSS